MIIESELKFALDPGQTRRLLKSKLLKRSADGKAVQRRLVSTYFDTRQHVLRKAGGALRIRESGEHREQTLKLPAPGPIGMQNNEEWTVPVSGRTPDLGLFDRAVARRLGRRGRRANLAPVFTSDFQRTAVALRRGKTRFEMALDLGELRAPGPGARTMPLCEVEFELLKGHPLPMLDFILALSDEIDLQPAYLTKAQRGYALARPALRPKSTKAQPVIL